MDPRLCADPFKQSPLPELEASTIPDTHDVSAEEHLLILHFPQKGLKGISCIDNPGWFELLIDNGNMYKASLFHDRQDIVQHVVWAAGRDISRHHGRSRKGIEAPLPVSDLTYDVRFGNDTDHRSVGIAHDHEGPLRVA
jgi:hypothetical protein